MIMITMLVINLLLIQASSYRMELAMCIMTVFSITILCYVVADLDSPFNGFFRVSKKEKHPNIKYLNAVLNI